MPPSQKYNRDRDAFLGMSTGTAANRLRKQILFRCVQRLGEDICYRCSKKIETVEEFSIEHKQSWMNVDVMLFWNLDNIAFSHLACNCEASDKSKWKASTLARNHERRMVGPEGTSWCSKHKEFLPVSEFTKYKGRWNGLSPHCRTCWKNRDRRKRKVAPWGDPVSKTGTA